MQSQDNQPMNSLDDSQILAQLPTQDQGAQSPLNDSAILNSLPVDNNQLEETFKKTLDADPDRAAKIIKYQERLNAPLSYIDRNLDRIQKADSAPDTAFWANYEKNFPKSSAFLKDARNMAMAKDDLENLAQTEGLIDDHSFIRQAYGSVMSGINAANESILKTPAFIYDAAAIPQNFLAKAMGRDDLQVKAPEFLASGLGAGDYYKGQKEAFSMMAPENDGAIIEKAKAGDYKGAARGLLLSFLQNAPNQAIILGSAMLGNPAAGLSYAGLTTAAGANSEAKEQGKDPLLSTVNAAASGAIEAGFESLGTLGAFAKWENSLSKVIGQAETKKVMKELAKTMAYSGMAEGNEEFLTSIGQDLSASMTIDSNATDGMLGRALNAGLIGSFSGTAMTGPSAIASGYMKAKQAQANKDFFLALGENINNSKLRGRLPEAQQNVLAEMTKDGPVENIYIPVEDFNVHCQKNNIDPKELAGLLGIEKAHDEATKTNDDLVIPTATFGAKLAGTELYNGLADVIKFSRNAFSVKQNKEMSERLAEELKTEYESLKVKFDDKQKLQDGYDLVYNNEMKKMNEAADKAGLDSKQREEFKKNATLFAQYVTVHAAKTGQEVKDVYQGTINPEYSFGGEFNEASQRSASDPFDAAMAAQDSAIQEQKKKEFLQNVVSEDVILKTLKGMGKSEAYHSPEAVKHVRESLALMLSEIQESRKGERNFKQGEFGSDMEVSVNSSTFPQWFRDLGFKTKKEVQSWIKNGKSKDFKLLIEKAVERAENGYKEENHGYDNPNLEFLKLVNPEKAASLEKEMQENPGKFFQAVWHGTPHDFDEFKLNAIGTGEGAQAYGWGLYFASDRKIAEWYKNKLSEAKMTLNGDRVDIKAIQEKLSNEMEGDRDITAWALATIAEEGGVDNALAKIEKNIRTNKNGKSELAKDLTLHNEKVLSEINAIKGKVTLEQGRLYKVDIPESEDMLDWDKKISEQSPKVRAILNKELEKYRTTDGVDGFAASENRTGEDIYKDLCFQAKMDQVKTSFNNKSKYATAKVKRLLKDAQTIEDMELTLANDGDSYRELTKKFKELGETENWAETVAKDLFLESEDLTDSQAAEIASKRLLSLGIAGLKYLDANSRLEEKESHNFVIFDDSQVKIKSKHFQATYNKGPQGMVDFNAERPLIQAFSSKDKSTLFHETAHVFLQHQFEVFKSGEMNEALSKDFKVLKDWLDIKDDQVHLTSEQHEKWARHFEGYLMTGEAPSSALRKVFKAAKNWLVKIYKTLEGLSLVSGIKIEISPEIKGVMDRMIATEEEIQAALAETKQVATLDLTGLDEKTVKQIEGLKEEAHDEAVKTLLAPQMEELTKEREHFLAEKRREATDKAIEELEDVPLYAAIEQVKGLAPNSDIKEMANMHKQGLLSEDVEAAFDIIAEENGFTSGDQLAGDIIGAPSAQEEIENRVNDEMKKHADLKDTAAIKIEALAAIHNEKSLELLAIEQQILDAKKEAFDKDETLKAQAKLREEIEKAKEKQDEKDEKAKEKLAEKEKAYQERWAEAEAKLAKQVEEGLAKTRANRDLEAMIPTLKRIASELMEAKPLKEAMNVMVYITAERENAIKAAKAAQRGDYKKASEYKRFQILNHAMVLHSLAVKKQFDKNVKKLNAFKKKDKKLYKKEEHFNQAAGLLARFGFFHKNYDPALKTETLSEWIARMEEAGQAPSIEPWLLEEVHRDKQITDYKTGELQDLVDAVTSIHHIANVENSLQSIEKGQEIKTVLTQLIAASDGATDAKDKFSHKMLESDLDKAKRGLGSWFTFHKMGRTIFKGLDKFKDGGTWERLIHWNQHKCADKETSMLAEYRDKIDALWSVYDKKEKRELRKKREFEEIGATCTKMELIAMALNLGNADNRKRLFDSPPVGINSKNWSESTCLKLLQNNLTEKDWALVQNAWDIIDSLWPHISEVHKNATGFAPKKIEAAPFVVITKDGKAIKMNGGYYPLAQDPRGGDRAMSLEVSDQPLYTSENPSWKASTKKGFTKERQKNAKYPVRLDVTLINRHVRDVIHDVAFRGYIMDMNRILANKELEASVTATLGPNGFPALKAYVQQVAGVQNDNDIAVLSSVISWLRKAGATAMLPLRASTTIQNLANSFIYGGAVKSFGQKEAWKAFIIKGIFNYIPKAALHWKKAEEIRALVFSKSKFMQERHENSDFSFKELHNKLYKESAKDEVVDFMIGTMGYFDELVSIPTWLQAYENELEKTNDEEKAIRYADDVIEGAIGSSRRYDQAPIITSHNDLLRAITPFYSFLNAQMNAWIVTSGVAKQGGWEGKKIALQRVAACFFAFTIASTLLSGKGPDDDADDEEKIKYWIKQMASYPVSFFPGARDVFTVYLDYATGSKNYGYRPSPLTALPEATFKAFQKAKKGDTQGTAEQASKIAAMALGYPDQLNNWFWNAYDYTINGMSAQAGDIIKRRPANER